MTNKTLSSKVLRVLLQLRQNNLSSSPVMVLSLPRRPQSPLPCIFWIIFFPNWFFVTWIIVFARSPKPKLLCMLLHALRIGFCWILEHKHLLEVYKATTLTLFISCMSRIATIFLPSRPNREKHKISKNFIILRIAT